MNLQEQIEKSFLAGADFMRDQSWCDCEEDVEMPTDYEVIQAATDYINRQALVDGSK